MNTDSPLIPQGSLLEQRNKGRARVKIAVFVVLAIHGIGVLALLMQGCKPSTGTDQTLSSQTATNETQVFQDTTNNIVPAETNTPTMVASNPVYVPPADTNAMAGAGASALAMTEYKIAAGDTLAKIATHNHVTLKALQDANPGVDPTKLRIGQTIHIPAPAATNGSSVASAVAAAAPTGTIEYVVKSGDSLTKIATDHKTTVKALRSLNALKTDKIVVGQKLKVPVKASNGDSTVPAATNGGR